MTSLREDCSAEWANGGQTQVSWTADHWQCCDGSLLPLPSGKIHVAEILQVSMALHDCLWVRLRHQAHILQCSNTITHARSDKVPSLDSGPRHSCVNLKGHLACDGECLLGSKGTHTITLHGVIASVTHKSASFAVTPLRCRAPSQRCASKKVWQLEILELRQLLMVSSLSSKQSYHKTDD